MLPPDEAILLSGRQRPALLAMPPYYALPALRELSARPPFPLPQAAVPAVSYLPLDDPQAAEFEAWLASRFPSSPAAWAA